MVHKFGNSRSLQQESETTKWLIDDPTITWVTRCHGGQMKQSSEANETIIAKDGKDRRNPVENRDTDNNPMIFKCIGRMGSQWPQLQPPSQTQNNEKIAVWGSATVFRYDKESNMCYVLTCAHNVVAQDIQEPEKFHRAQIVQFYRMETLPSTKFGSQNSQNTPHAPNTPRCSHSRSTRDVFDDHVHRDYDISIARTYSASTTLHSESSLFGAPGNGFCNCRKRYKIDVADVTYHPHYLKSGRSSSW